MNAVLSTLLILALAVAIFFDYIRIVQYVRSRTVIKKSNKWIECKFAEIESNLTQIQTNIKLIYGMSEDCRTYRQIMLNRSVDIQEQILKILSIQYKQYKQLKEIQDALCKIRKGK